MSPPADQQDSPAPLAHWMLREIHEQPAALAHTFAHYVAEGAFKPETTDAARRWLRETNGEIVIAASGSSRHAGMVAEIMLEDFSGIAVDVEYASEYTYRSANSLKNASVLVISQSGETADTLAALRKASAAGRRSLAITNVPDSTMAREAEVSLPTLSGRERAIPATKSFTGQLLVLHLLTLLAAEVRGTMSAEEIRAALAQLEALPAILTEWLPRWEQATRDLAATYKPFRNFLFLGRGLHFPIAREGALKLKESSYLHAEGYPSGELKHGPNAIVNDATPLVMLATVDRNDPDSVARYQRVLQLMEDMRQQHARILCLANEGDSAASALAGDTIAIPALPETLLPLAEVIPLQLLAYFMAIQLGIDVDSPRNLVKSVIVE
jgi:glucosamine--fructose-6-phosphate aminotransferase (isomerizing)